MYSLIRILALSIHIKKNARFIMHTKAIIYIFPDVIQHIYNYTISFSCAVSLGGPSIFL